MTPRAVLGLLFHADKALDLVRAAYRMGILAELDAGPVTLAALAATHRARPLRLYKFLDGLESLGLVRREQPADDILSAEYHAIAPLLPAYQAVLGETSVERDRDRYRWREIYGRLPEVLAGSVDTQFAWPPQTAADIAGFERSMSLGCPPIIEALREARETVFDGARRWLDVGGGDGTIAAAILAEVPRLRADVLNLAAVEPLVRERAGALGDRLGFVAADFLAAPLPAGYDVMSFIRVLHDWPADVARTLIRKAHDALAPGARIVICEEFRDPDRLAVQFFWTYFLTGADACVSRLRELEWYVAALTDAGFADVDVVCGAFDLVVAVRA